MLGVDLRESLNELDAFGLRFQGDGAYNNVRQGFLPSYKGEGIVNRFARYQTDLLDITIGDFYEQFGNGLMLRAYYEPGLLYDNSIDGARIISSPYKGFTFKGLIGKQRLFFGKGPGIVRGFDGELNVKELFDSILGNKKTRVILVGSFVSKFQPDQDNNLVIPENVGCYGGRINIIREGFNFNTEYAYKINDPSADNNGTYKFGDALFTTISYAGKGFSILLQGKRLDNMSYRSDRNEGLQNLLINYLPATTKQHSYPLLALNPYATQLKGEIGFMAEAQYKVKKGTPIGGKYGGVQLQFSDLLVAKPMIRRHHVHARLPDIERIRPARLSECVVDKRGALTDLSMHARLGRRERSLQEYEALLDRTGFSVIATSRTAFELTPNVARHRAQSWAPLWSAVRRSHWSRNQTDG